MEILKWAKGYGVVKFLQGFVTDHPADEYAKDAANELRKIVENEIGEKRADIIRDVIIPWVDIWYVTFRKELLK